MGAALFRTEIPHRTFSKKTNSPGKSRNFLKKSVAPPILFLGHLHRRGSPADRATRILARRPYTGHLEPCSDACIRLFDAAVPAVFKPEDMPSTVSAGPVDNAGTLVGLRSCDPMYKARPRACDSSHSKKKYNISINVYKHMCAYIYICTYKASLWLTRKFWGEGGMGRELSAN